MVIEEKIMKTFHSSAAELDLEAGKTMKLNYISQLGYFFRITCKEEINIRQNSTFKIIDAIKGGVRFTNKTLSKLNESYKELKEVYETQQDFIVKEIFDVAGKYTKKITHYVTEFYMFNIY